MSDGSHTYYYDAEHHLVQVDGSEGWCASGTGTEATACYTYDAEGQRMRRTVPGSGITDDYLYDLSGHYITQVSGGGWWIRGEIYAGGRHLATYENDLGTPTTFFGDGDSLGTERVETGVDGTACETITSLPFGDGLSTSGGCDPSAKYFEGKERDWESNLDNFGARFYSSQLGRWMSADWSAVPIPVPYANLSNPQTLNLFAMVADNPETFADLDGHQCGNVGASDRNGCTQEGNSKTATQGEGFKAQDKSKTQEAQTTAEQLGALSRHFSDGRVDLGRAVELNLLNLADKTSTAVDDKVIPEVDVSGNLGPLGADDKGFALQPTLDNGASVDFKFGAPPDSSTAGEIHFGLGKHLSLGTNLTTDGKFQGLNVSVGPSEGSPVGGSAALGSLKSGFQVLKRVLVTFGAGDFVP